MAAITLERLKQLMAECYAAGYRGPLDLKDSFVNELVTEVFKSPDNTGENDGWTNYTIRDLKAMPIGTILEHSKRGKCWIESGAVGISTDGRAVHMRFEDGSIAHFHQDASPWLDKMRVVGKTMKQPEKKRPKSHFVFNQH
jgi:hypothetical protein